MTDGDGLGRGARLDPLPAGARDLVGAAASRRRALTAELMATFARWGYQEVVAPNLEYFDVLGRGLSEDERRKSVRFIAGDDGKLVTLRADVTPQIARVVAQRLAPRVRTEGGARDESFRVCYAADVVRLPESAHERSEIHQVGVEFVGNAEPVADAELICLVHQALSDAGLSGFRIELAHRAVIHDALAAVGLDASVLARSGDGAAVPGLAGHLARKDARGLDAALERHGVGGKARKAFTALVHAFGAPDEVLAQASKSLRPLKVKRALERLARVVSLVESLDEAAAASLLIDLGEVRGFDYYTGLRLRVWAPGVAEPVVRGGRYNDMVGRFGLDLPATGFGIDLDALERAQAAALGDHHDLTTGGALFAVDPAGGEDALVRAGRAAAEARREVGVTAWVEARPDLDAAKAAAERAGAARLTWFGKRMARYERTEHGWQREGAATGARGKGKRKRRGS